MNSKDRHRNDSGWLNLFNRWCVDEEEKERNREWEEMNQSSCWHPWKEAAIFKKMPQLRRALSILDQENRQLPLSLTEQACVDRRERNTLRK